MAEVLTINLIDSDCPITERCGCVNVGDYIYINTSNSIYRYDMINNIYTLLFNKPNNTYIAIATDNTYLYMIRQVSGSTGAICRYKISDGTYNGNFKTVKWQSSSSVSLDTLYIKNNILYMNLVAYPNYAYNKKWVYNIGTDTLNEYGFTFNGFGSNTQIVDGYFFGMLNGSNPPKTLKDFGIINDGEGVTIKGQWPNLPSLTHGTFFHGGLYYLTYTNKIYSFNPANNTFNELTTQLPVNMGGSWVAGKDGNYFTFYNGYAVKISFIDYNLTYKIANKTGSEIYKELTGQSPITQVRFNYSGTGDVGYVFNTLSGTISGSYTPNIPSGYKLVGFGSAPNTKLALAGLNTDVSVSINENFTFYEIYQVYKPPATTFEMDLYQNTAENNRVDKTDYLTSVGSLFGALRAECSILKPSIIIEQEELPAFNYVYIGAFNRYYFVTGITSVAYRMWRIELSTDVLMTYKNGIALLTAIIARQENDYNDNLIDAEIPVEKTQTVTFEEIPNTVLNTQESDDNHSFVVTVVGA